MLAQNMNTKSRSPVWLLPRREESLSRVPISVAAFTQQQMDAQGLKQIDDLQRFTPGLVLTHIGNSGNQISRCAVCQS